MRHWLITQAIIRTLASGVVLAAPAAFAQAAFEPPPFDPGAIPTPGEEVFNSDLPFGPPQAPLPIQPAAIPEVQQYDDRGPTTLPQLPTDEAFEFFQPGYQWKDDGAPVVDTTPAKPEIDPNAGKKKKKVARPHFIWHDFHNQHLPHTIYKKQYRPENRHLPVAVYEQELDAQTFVAAARNDLNALRALINGGRDIHMINGYGETLLTVAAKHSAHTTVRYLLAKGLHPGTADPARADMQTRVALKSVQGRWMGGTWVSR